MTDEQRNRAHEEAKARVAKDEAELAEIEAEVASIGLRHPGPVFMTMFEALLELVFSLQGNFKFLYKQRFYKAVLARLQSKGLHK